MSKLHTRHLISTILGVENEEGEAVLDGDKVTVTAGDTVIEIETLTTEGTEGEAAVELVEGDAEVEEVATEVDTMAENVEALENLAADLRVAIEDGGLSPQAAVYFQHAHAAIAGRHFDMSKRTLAVESFGSASRRLQMTKDAHEGIIDTIKSFIKAIVDFVKKMVKKVVDWFKNLVDSKRRLKVRLEALEKAVANMGSELKDRNAKLALPEGLTMGGRAPQPSALISAMKVVSVTGNSLATKQRAMVTDINTLFANVKRDAATAQASVSSAIAATITKFSKPAGGSGFDVSEISASTGATVLNSELPGSKIVIETAPSTAYFKAGDDSASPASALGNVGFRLVNIRKGLKMDAKLEIKPLNSGECLSMLSNMTSFLDAKALGGDAYQTLANTADDSLQILQDIADDLDNADSSAAAPAAGATAGAKAREIRSLATGVQSIISNTGSQLLKIETYCFQRCQAGANLVASSIKAYK